MQLLNNIKYITGDPEEFNLQHRLLNASLFAVIVLNIIALFTNIILQLNWAMNVLNIITVFLFSILFFYSREGGNQRLVEMIGFGFIILIFSPIMWFFNGGANSSFQYYIPLILVGIHVSGTVKARRILIPLMIFMAMALMVVEYLHPEFVIEYPSRFVRYADLMSGFFISLTGIYLFANVYFNQITEANNKLRMQNQHLTKIKEDLLVYQQKIKRQNSELEEKNKKLEELTATKNMFLSIISHDLRSPFNSLLGLTEILILNKEQVNDQETLRLINSIHESAEQAYKLVLNLLEWSRLESDRIEYQPERVNLSTLVKSNIELVKIQAKNKEITIRYNNGIHDCVVYADKNMINTVVRNLISNALKYTNKGGRIDIECTCSGEMCQVSIKDNGIGISEDLLEQILTDENKVSTKGTAGELGTGLGLVLCNEFARRNKGGRIDIECTCSGEMCQVSIKDNGIGISEDLLEQILTDENKISTKGTAGELGTGLGLVLCNEFARRNRGRISVESKLGKGSTFTLHLPVYVEN